MALEQSAVQVGTINAVFARIRRTGINKFGAIRSSESLFALTLVRGDLVHTDAIVGTNHVRTIVHVDVAKFALVSLGTGADEVVLGICYQGAGAVMLAGLQSTRIVFQLAIVSHVVLCAVARKSVRFADAGTSMLTGF